MMRSMKSGIAIISLLLAQSGLADEFSNISDIENCRAIPSDSERLLCYDTVMDGGVFNQQVVQKAQEEKFGDAKERQDITVEKVIVTINRIERSPTGVHYFYTDEGTVWKQSGAGRWSVKAPFEAEIRSGVLSSYFLVIEGGKSTRVKRVK